MDNRTLVRGPLSKIAHKTAGGGITSCGMTIGASWREATLKHRPCKRCR